VAEESGVQQVEVVEQGCTGDSCIALPRNYSGFSEASGTL
jgi:hypothetical protein